MNVTNEELVLKYQAGDVSFDEVFEQCQKLVYKEAGRWMIKGLEQEDKLSILMNAFWEACLRFDGSRGIKFSTFCTNHLRYVIRDHWRRATTLSSSKYQVLSIEGTLSVHDRRTFEEGLIQVAPQPDQAAINRELTQFVNKYLTQAPEPGRSFAYHYLFDQMTKSEVAIQYGVKNQNIHYHLSRVLKTLQQKLILEDWK